MKAMTLFFHLHISCTWNIFVVNKQDDNNMVKAIEEMYIQNNERMEKSFYIVLKSGKAFLRK